MLISFQSSAIPHYVIWSQLFKIYQEYGNNSKDLHKKMWDMLCDLEIIKNLIKRKGKFFYFDVADNYTNILFEEGVAGITNSVGDLYIVEIDYESFEISLEKIGRSIDKIT